MKWGVRRYQNPDGTRTRLGAERERLAYENQQAHKIADKYVSSMEKKSLKASKKAEEKPTNLKKSKADMAKKEYESSKKIAKKYTDAMDKKYSKRNAKLDKIEAEEKRHYNINPKDVKRNMDYMSDADLRIAINRIEMQNRVKDLNKSTIARGRNRLRNYSGTINDVNNAIDAYNKMLMWMV